MSDEQGYLTEPVEVRRDDGRTFVGAIVYLASSPAEAEALSEPGRGAEALAAGRALFVPAEHLPAAGEPIDLANAWPPEEGARITHWRDHDPS